MFDEKCKVTCSVTCRACGISESASDLLRISVKLQPTHNHDSSFLGVP
jgi:hypothetical protein